AVSNAQVNEITVSGTVKDAVGPLSGVTVRVKSDSSQSVATDSLGAYQVKAPSNGTLVFTAISFKPQEIDIKGEGTINVVMELADNTLNEVAVVAFGVQKKASVVGAISTVNVQELKTPVRSLNNALAGKIAGVIAVQRSGEPGYDDAQFWI